MSDFKTVLVCVDTELGTHPSVDLAAVIAGQDGARLKLLDVVKDFACPTRLALPDLDRIKIIHKQRIDCLIWTSFTPK